MDYEQGFAGAIKANPKDKTNWGVYADWLEEQNDPRYHVVRYFLRQNRDLGAASYAFLRANADFKWLLAKSFKPALFALQLNCSLETAEQVIKLMKPPAPTGNGRASGTQVSATLNQINTLIKGHGVESVEAMNRFARYVNTGDTYSATILFDSGTGRYSLTTWGDWFERFGERG